MSIASIVLALALGAGVCALGGLVLAIIGVARRWRRLVRVGFGLSALGAVGFVVAGTLTLGTAVEQGAAAAVPTPTVLEQRQWFRIATGITLPAGSDPIVGAQRPAAGLPTYYLLITPSPALERMLARDFTATEWSFVQGAFTPAPALPAWRLSDGPGMRYYTRTHELPSRAVFVSSIAVDQASQAVYFVGRQVSD